MTNPEANHYYDAILTHKGSDHHLQWRRPLDDTGASTQEASIIPEANETIPDTPRFPRYGAGNITNYPNNEPPVPQHAYYDFRTKNGETNVLPDGKPHKPNVLWTRKHPDLNE